MARPATALRTPTFLALALALWCVGCGGPVDVVAADPPGSDQPAPKVADEVPEEPSEQAAEQPGEQAAEEPAEVRFGPATREWARRLGASGELAEEKNRLWAAYRADREDAVALWKLAHLYEWSGPPRTAASRLRGVKDLAPDEPYVRQRLGELLARDARGKKWGGDKTAAEPAFRDALRELEAAAELAAGLPAADPRRAAFSEADNLHWRGVVVRELEGEEAAEQLLTRAAGPEHKTEDIAESVRLAARAVARKEAASRDILQRSSGWYEREKSAAVGLLKQAVPQLRRDIALVKTTAHGPEERREREAKLTYWLAAATWKLEGIASARPVMDEAAALGSADAESWIDFYFPTGEETVEGAEAKEADYLRGRILGPDAKSIAELLARPDAPGNMSASEWSSWKRMLHKEGLLATELGEGEWNYAATPFELSGLFLAVKDVAEEQGFGVPSMQKAVRVVKYLQRPLGYPPLSDLGFQIRFQSRMATNADIPFMSRSTYDSL